MSEEKVEEGQVQEPPVARLDEATRQSLVGDMPFSSEGRIQFTPEYYQKPRNRLVGKGKDRKQESFYLEDKYQTSYELRGWTQVEKKRAIKVREDLKNADPEELEALARVATMGWKQQYDVGTGLLILYRAADNGGADARLFGGIPECVKGEIFWQLMIMSGLVDVTLLGLRSSPQPTQSSSDSVAPNAEVTRSPKK